MLSPFRLAALRAAFLQNSDATRVFLSPVGTPSPLPLPIRNSGEPAEPAPPTGSPSPLSTSAEFTAGLFAALEDSSEDAIISKDLTGKVVTWNKAAERLFGFSTAEMVGHSILRLIPPEFAPEEALILQTVMRGQRITHFETVRLRKDGTRIPVSLIVAPVKNLQGQVIGATKIAKDLSRARDAGDHRRLLAAIVDSSEDAIISKNLSGIITSWNTGAERIFGYTSEEAIGRHVSFLFPADRLNEEIVILDRIKRGERIEHFKTVRRRKDGQLLDISLSVSPIQDASGAIIGASKIARDVSALAQSDRALIDAHAELARLNDTLERQSAEKAALLQRAMAQIEDFSYTVSHDLRAPIRAILAYSEILLADYLSALPSDAQSYLRRIAKNAARLDKMLLDLLAYSRVSRAEVSLTRVDLNQVVADSLQQFPVLQPPQGNVTVHPLLAVHAYEPLLTRAVSNLLTNAATYLPLGASPQIKIWTEPRGDFVRLCIQDNGVGIPPEVQPRLFHIFELINPALPDSGNGAGLAIAKKAIDRMNGQVGMQSDGKTGSTFWIELPAAD